MSFTFTDKVVIVTGSTKGIGRTIALHFLKHQSKVVINVRNAENLEKARLWFVDQGFDPLTIAGDVSDPVFCRQMMQLTMEAYGRIDILINNAGQPMRGNFEDMSPEFFKQVVDANLMTAAYTTMAALPYLKQSKGSVIFISSLSGGVRGIPHSAPYSVGKMGLLALAQTLQVEMYDHQVHFGIVKVGFVDLYEGKRVLNYDGKYIEVNRKGHQSEQDVANAVERLIKNRRFQITQTTIGKTLAFFQSIAPRFVDWCLIRTRNSEMYK